MTTDPTNDPAPRTCLLSPEVPGGLGEFTELDTSVHPPLVHRLHVEFSGWLGDDLVRCFQCHLVTQRLAVALEGDGITGVVFDDVVLTTDPQFDGFFPETASNLPS